MTKLEKTVEALRRCIPAAEFEKALTEVEAADTAAAKSWSDEDTEKMIREALTELGTPDRLSGHRYLITALLLVVDRPEYLGAITGELYPAVAAEHNSTVPRVERGIRHAIEVTWDSGDWDVLGAYFGNTVSLEKGKPMNSEFLARLGNIIRQKVKEAQR